MEETEGERRFVWLRRGWWLVVVVVMMMMMMMMIMRGIQSGAAMRGRERS